MNYISKWGISAMEMVLLHENENVYSKKEIMDLNMIGRKTK